MSRVGKAPIKVHQGVKVEIKGNQLKVQGPKGTLEHQLPEGVSVKLEKDSMTVEAAESLENGPALRGVTRSLVYNMVHGVHTGFTRELDVVGVGYRCQSKGKSLTLNLGYSHPIEYELPEGVSCKVEKNTHLVLSGIDKMTLGMVAAKIRSFRPPEPYRGKGVKYTDERIIRKQGKAAGAK